MLEWLNNQSRCWQRCVSVKLSQLSLKRNSQQWGTSAVFKCSRSWSGGNDPSGWKGQIPQTSHPSQIKGLVWSCCLCFILCMFPVWNPPPLPPPTSLILRLFALKRWGWCFASDSWLMLNVFVSAGLMPSGYSIDCWLDVMTATFSHHPHIKKTPLHFCELEFFIFFPSCNYGENCKNVLYFKIVLQYLGYTDWLFGFSKIWGLVKISVVFVQKKNKEKKTYSATYCPTIVFYWSKFLYCFTWD